MVLGKASYDRCAKESPSITISGRPESAGALIFLARFDLQSYRPVRGGDLPVLGELVAAAIVG
jgi:hypothetical protein